ncbi:hypothetical protein VMCG_09037 [Cytospora schulzeri]|uniref:Major facilitator superfamily (MFS) profile domain-containing protein n=1 Tax=Cytospora schulzeri TaxID=448051 RepID=A0A423VP06_9PEZI|nr:hypothetical protein VMCG_09037 [Valsa malicola]
MAENYRMGRGSRASHVRMQNPMRNANIHPDIVHITDRHEREIAILRILDSIGFNWPVFYAIAIGFLASSYSLFATNIVSPALLYVYPPGSNLKSNVSEVLDLTTLSSTLVGMVVFGHFADRGGRKRLYGLELIIIILATMGLVLSSQGIMGTDEDGHPKSSMDIYVCIIFFRCFLGFGIGAEYPVSAVIAAEFASTDTRAIMMAGIFLMQSVGRFLAVGIGLGALRRVSQGYGLDMAEQEDGMVEIKAKIVIDIVWRIVIGMGGVIALAAVGLRFIIPESPRYYSGIQKDLRKAALAVKQAGGKPDDLRSELSVSSGAHHSFSREENLTPWTSGAYKYLKQGGWRALAGMSSIWFLLDVCFYGNNLDSPTTLNALWLSSSVYNAEGPVVNGTVAIWNATGIEPVWNSDPGWPNATIQQTLTENSVRSLLLSSIASLAGSIVAVPVIHFANRKRLLIVTSLALTLLFIATGTSVVKMYGTPDHVVGMVFFALTQFMFNLGPNTLTFILPAEIFPTIFRGTFYGISAASGKLGAIIIRAIVAKAGTNQTALTAYLFVFSVIMLILALIAVLPGALPEVQHDLKKEAQEPEPTGHDVELSDQSSQDEAETHWWDAYFPMRWRSKTLEEIARGLKPEDEFALQGNDNPVLEKDIHPARVLLPTMEDFVTEQDPQQNDFGNGDLIPEALENGTKELQAEMGQRFSSRGLASE